MTLIFNIEYRTSWGEEVRVLGSIPELGNNQPNKATPLHTVDGIHWTAEVDIQIPGNGSVEYSYHIYRDGRTIRTEWNSLPRILHVADNPKKVYRIEDCWRTQPAWCPCRPGRRCRRRPGRSGRRPRPRWRG